MLVWIQNISNGPQPPAFSPLARCPLSSADLPSDSLPKHIAILRPVGSLLGLRIWGCFRAIYGLIIHFEF